MSDPATTWSRGGGRALGVSNRDSKDRAYRELKRLIVTLKFRPGDRILEEDMASRLGLSRTPIRQALMGLEKEGFVERTPGIGYYVRRLSLREVRSLYEARAIVEPATARLAVEHASDAELDGLEEVLNRGSSTHSDGDNLEGFVSAGVGFHASIAAMSGNKVLLDIIRNLNERVNMIGLLGSRMPNRAEIAYKEHLKILEHLCARDGVMAAEAVKNHILNARDSAIQALMEGGDLYVQG